MKHIPRYNQKAVWLIVLILAQIVIVLLNGWWGFMGTTYTAGIPIKMVTFFSLIAGVFLAVTSIYLINEIIRLSTTESEAILNKAKLEDSKELIDVLRLHRHDYLNHLQVIMGSIQLKRNDYALEYIKEVIQNLKTESTISNLKHPEVAALLLKKIHQAEERAIPLEVDMESDLSGLEIPSPVLTRLLGNLVDNALDAVQDITGPERKVEVAFLEDAQHFIIEVFNRWPIIHDDLQDKIFEKGFTTKGNKGSGFGLFITKSLMEQNGGVVKLCSSEDEGTLFQLYFPKKSDSFACDNEMDRSEVLNQ